ncbi:MAG: lamin tail domain-containing protein, partial [Planctomycetota bacterium]
MNACARFCITLFALVVCCSTRLVAAPWIVFTEIHYHPLDEGLEFVEIHLREPPRVDLSGWTLSGEVDFKFPAGSVLMPGEYIVVAKDPNRLIAASDSLEKCYGPFKGKLDNGGGRVVLRNSQGAVLAELRYDRSGRWPKVPDGSGHSLSIGDPLYESTNPDNWRASRVVGGTPGVANGERRESSGTLLVKEGDEWRYFRGTRNPPRTWTDVDFDDRRWDSGPSGFGYSDGDDATELNDMSGNYMSVYTRRVFSVPNPVELKRLFLSVDFDDGFAAYLNGEEVARFGLGNEGSVVPADQPADGKHEAGNPVIFDLGRAEERLTRGENVLAVEVHNGSIDSSDLSLIVELESRDVQAAAQSEESELRINECFVSSTSSRVEIYNPRSRVVSLGEYALTSDPRALAKFPFAEGAEV